MEVVRSYDIARLVLGYLRDNKLDKAAKAFCKTSPYLNEELELLRKGFWPVSLRHDHLPDIIREYCQIQSEVIQFFDSLTERDKEKFPKHGTLLSKVHLLIKVAKGTLEGKIEGVAGGKRKKTVSEDTNTSLEATQEKDLPGYSPPISKRRRISSSFLCLANHRSKNTAFSSDEESAYDRSPESNSSEVEGKIPQSKAQRNKESSDNAQPKEDASKAQTQTPSKTELPIPTFPDLSEALLINTEFQNKLVENINKVLTSGPPIATEAGNLTKNKPVSDHASDEMRTQFEEMIKNILDETEKDPTFSELVENIVLSNTSETKPLTNTQYTQCSPTYAPDKTLNTPIPAKNTEATIKDRLRPRKSNTSYADVPKEGNNENKFITPCKLGANISELKSGDNSMSLSKLIVLNPSDTMTTSTPLISDSILASSGSQLLNQIGDNIFIDMNTGQTFPFFMTNNMNTIFLDTSTDALAGGENLQLGKIIDSQNLETMNFIPQEQIRLPQINPQDNSVVTVTIVKNESSASEVKGFTPDHVTKITPSESQKSPLVQMNPNGPVKQSEIETDISKKVSLPIENTVVATAPVNPSKALEKNITPLPSAIDKTKAAVESIPSGTISEARPTTTGEISDTACTAREKSTPALSAISKELTRSLSTPRRQSSHVRVLNFSTPSESKSESKLSIKQPITPTVVTFTEAHSKAATSETVVPVPIASEPTAIVNELSNSSSNNDFAKTTTDVTVIHQSISETPKRKSEGRRSCVRVLTRSCSEDEPLNLKISAKSKSTKKVAKPSRAKVAAKPQRRKPRQPAKPISSVKYDNPPPTNPMEAWTRLRSIPTGQWDQHLREVCAIEEATNPAPPTVRKKRGKGRGCQKQNKKATPIKSSHDIDDVDATSNQAVSETQQSAGKQSAKKALIEFKIATPLKAGKSPGKLKTKVIEVSREHVSETIPNSTDSSITKPTTVSESHATIMPTKSTVIHAKPISTQELLDSRTSNIGLLLDTPYKIDASAIPITPRFLVPDANTTPMIRMTTFQGQISICKNPDLPTPNYAITPGAGLTPLDKDTPRSGYFSNYPTDYSSGSSYYKPDESEDLDKRFDTLMTENRRRAKEKSSPKRILNHPPRENLEAREISQEESSNQTVITAINTSEAVSQVKEHPKVLENTCQSDEMEKRNCSSRTSCRSDDRRSNSMRRSSSSSSSNSSDSNSSSSDSISDSSANNTDDENEISCPDSESEAELEEKTDEKGSTKANVDVIEVRYSTRKSITPKKPNQVMATSPLKLDKKLEDVVDKIKNKSVAQMMRTKQIESLEEKRLRVKDTLKKDFAVMEKTPLKKPHSKISPAQARNRKVPIVASKQQKEEKKATQTKIEMLTALNLSEKGNEYSKQSKVGSSSASDIFDGEDYPKLRVDEDSKDSAETMEVRHAAYVLTKLSKGSIENKYFDSSSLDSVAVKNEEVSKLPAKNTKKGRPKRQKLADLEQSKMYAPHKPVTRGDSKMNQKLDVVDITTKLEASIEQKAFESKVQVDSIAKLVNTDAKTVRDNIITECNKSDPLPQQEESDEDDEEEDEDPYDACEMVSVNENDTRRYLQITYEPPRSGRKLISAEKSSNTQNLLSSIMNIFINGAPHKIVVTKETELFALAPTNKLKLQAKKEEKRPLVVPKKRQKSTDTRKGKSEKAEESDAAEKSDVIRVQPKINIKYKQRAPVKEKAKLKVEPVESGNDNKSNLKLSPKRIDENTIKSTNKNSAIGRQTSPEAQAPIKSEDIFAVLSLIHGQESDK